jgi:uncharacterized membrane protein (DUF373 family)
LTVILALELLETLKAYFAEHRVRLEVILIVSIIAVGRHALEIDFDHTIHHVTINLLRDSFYVLKRNAAPGTRVARSE